MLLLCVSTQSIHLQNSKRKIKQDLIMDKHLETFCSTTDVRYAHKHASSFTLVMLFGCVYCYDSWLIIKWVSELVSS